MKENPLIKVSDIDRPDVWFDLRVTCLSLLDSPSPSICQKGYVADESGAIQFVLWQKSSKTGVPELKSGKSYMLQNVVSNEYRGQFSIALVKSTKVQEIEDLGLQEEF